MYNENPDERWGMIQIRTRHNIIYNTWKRRFRCGNWSLSVQPENFGENVSFLVLASLPALNCLFPFGCLSSESGQLGPTLIQRWNVKIAYRIGTKEAHNVYKVLIHFWYVRKFSAYTVKLLLSRLIKIIYFS